MRMRPTFKLERQLIKEGFDTVIGVDEAGCGCLAGPVIAAAVCLPLNSRIAGIHDSKLLSAAQRIEIFKKFVGFGMRFTVGMASSVEVDAFNVRKATYLAMRRAINSFVGASFALVDAWTVPGIRIKQRGVVHGDRLIKSIAAASIVAKVVRDSLMMQFDEDYPFYGFANNKGYGTRAHYRGLKKNGLCPIHRRSFLKEVEIAD